MLGNRDSLQGRIFENKQQIGLQYIGPQWVGPRKKSPAYIVSAELMARISFTRIFDGIECHLPNESCVTIMGTAESKKTYWANVI